MINLLRCKFVHVTPPGALLDDASATTAEIDSVGYDFLLYIIAVGATDIAMAALAATESDTAGSNHANITGAVFGTSLNTTGSASTLPDATNADDDLFFIGLNLKKRKRYIDLTATAGNGSSGMYIAISAILEKGEAMPRTAIAMGTAYSQMLLVT